MTGKKYNFQYCSKTNAITENVNNDAEVNVVRFDDYYCGNDFTVTVSFADNEDEIIDVFIRVFATLSDATNLYRFFFNDNLPDSTLNGIKQCLRNRCPNADDAIELVKTREEWFEILKRSSCAELCRICKNSSA